VKDGAGTWVLNFSTRPDRQVSMNGWDYFDYEIRATLKDGQTSITFANSLLGKTVRPAESGDPSGLGWSAETKDGGYTVEISISKEKLVGWGTSPRGLMSGQLCWVSGSTKWIAASSLAAKRYSWPLWELKGNTHITNGRK